MRENGSDGRGSYAATGTGYPVGEDLILTARHVVRPQSRDARYPIRVRWVRFPDFGDGGRINLDPDDSKAIAYPGTRPAEEDDIVLLRCPDRPTGVHVVAWPWGKMPVTGASYESIGYPSATAFHCPSTGRPDPRQNVFKGEVRVSAEPWFEITDSQAPKTAEDWQGASGMPIFVDGAIVGVSSASLHQIHGKVYAIPVAPSLQRDEFRALFVDARFQERWQTQRNEVRRDVETLLDRSPALLERLREAMDRLDCLPSDASIAAALMGPDSGAGQGAQAGNDTEDRFARFSQIIGSVHDALRKEETGRAPVANLEDTRAALLAMVFRVAPMLYDRELAECACLSAARAEVLELRAALYSIAELMIAAAEEREAAFQQRQDRQERDARGIACLSIAVPELGLDASNEDYGERMLVHLGRKDWSVQSFDRTTFLADVDTFLDRHFYPKDRPRWGKADERMADQRTGIDDNLADYEDLNGQRRRLYTVFRPETADEYEEMKKTAETLRERYPNLRVVILTAFCKNLSAGAGNPWDADRSKIAGLIKILPVRAETKESRKS